MVESSQKARGQAVKKPESGVHITTEAVASGTSKGLPWVLVI